mgnify:CR=1 FL=1
MAKKQHTEEKGLAPVLALVLAWLVPGLGHVYIGRTVRGVILFITIGVLFWTGVAMGGVLTVDAQRSRGWFYAQMLTGAHGVASWYRQRGVYEQVETEIADKYGQSYPPGTRGRPQRVDAVLARQGLALAHPVEPAARAYSGVAGLLNLLAIFDAMMLAMLGRTGEPPPAEDEKPHKEART